MYRSTLALALVITFAALGQAPDAAQQTKAILDKAIVAMGGAEKLEKAKAQSWKTQGKMMAGGQTVNYTGEYTFAGADKFRFDIEMPFNGQKTTIRAATDGRLAWEQMGPQVRDMAADKRTEFHHNVYVMYVSSVIPLRDSAFTLSMIPDAKVGNSTLVGIQVSRAGRRDVSLYFDKKTHLLSKISTRMFDVDGAKKEITQETMLSGYQDKDGRKIFDRITVNRDGKEYIVEELSDQKFIETVDEKLFAKPASTK